MATPTIEELKAIIKEEGLKIQVRKTSKPEEILEKIKAKQAEAAEEAASPTESTEEKETTQEGTSTASKKAKVKAPKGSPDCFGSFVKEGAPQCRRCGSAQECKKV